MNNNKTDSNLSPFTKKQIVKKLSLHVEKVTIAKEN